MTKHKLILSFLDQLAERVHLDPNLSPKEVHVFNVHAAYGHYQVIIGPADKLRKHTSLKRPVEISGEVHHLFVTKNHVAPHPTHKEIHNNLKGCIIMRDLSVHIQDPTGSGRKPTLYKNPDAILAREKINLAGDEGEKILKRMEVTGKLAKETYKIIQEDILNALVNKQYTEE